MSSIPTQNCHFASIQGRRSYQEDRLTCNLDIKIPPFGLEKNVGVVAVFDGHIGSDASEMASKLFLAKFLRKNYDEQSSNQRENLKSSLRRLMQNSPRLLLNMKYIRDLLQLLHSYTTTKHDVGDSKAFICSQSLEAKELTEDHNANRLDERAGKFEFLPNYVPLLIGHFPMTRAIGDVPLKKYGIIATPEVTDLVVASDGIFESFVIFYMKQRIMKIYYSWYVLKTSIE
ncbi:hypothetical protein RND71_006826 [Anisodus tanguticus]|uniref:PPM-type phosphatase domain-containing protein n=1 Tax=Anisodus tanguticus TaxID=243964 RepID=A0AAE1VVY7_9SOLA|nr:hypothetical protein RND71_006826 [Anisodus tanguticus]